ncbi:MAG TPA: styrene monooxygenase/indole monooxygenase family protein [Jatrophihabitans sp.]|jgi:2-polyprenyl-6-methoxyphenol hydroxylase-like FAD-dependent oxidoreductase|uniref:styrene monooxygenase/indole monooxygenase family protein n=1 Tax=Jatrophihabitans sp. TaxID=1932789 RepID=UPI002F0463CB
MGIGIVGAGISGLHLALRLQQFGMEVTLYTAQDPEDIRTGPPLNFVTRFDSTRKREVALGVTEWASSQFDNPWMHMRLEGADLEFRGKLPSPASSVDFRMYLSGLLEELHRRDGKVARHAPLTRGELAKLAQRHDLLVVAAGRGAVTEVFPRDPARSPYDSAPRSLLGGLFTGVRPPEPAGMTMNMVPGAGEVHAPSYHSFGGMLTAILIEAVPGGPFEEVTLGDYRGDPDLLAKKVLDLITHHAPSLRERIDERAFGLARPGDHMQGALVPTVRHGVAQVADGRFAVAIGDAWIVNDPLTAQGANLGSQQAFEVAHLLSTHSGPYDEAFCRMVSDTLWQAAQPVVDWTNTFLGEPPPHVVKLLSAASADQRVADAFVANLDRPAEMWQSIRTPEDSTRFLAAVTDSGVVS